MQVLMGENPGVGRAVFLLEAPGEGVLPSIGHLSLVGPQGPFIFTSSNVASSNLSPTCVFLFQFLFLHLSSFVMTLVHLCHPRDSPFLGQLINNLSSIYNFNSPFTM